MIVSQEHFVSEVFYFVIKKELMLQMVVCVLCHAGGALLFTIEKNKN